MKGNRQKVALIPALATEVDVDILDETTTGQCRVAIVLAALVTRLPRPRSRRDRYGLRHNAWYSASMSENGFYDGMRMLSMPAIASAGGPDNPAGARIAEMAEVLRFIQRRLLELLAEWAAVRRPTAEVAGAPGT